MSGHSKWSTIKRQKGVADARRGASFTKAANAITIAARQGGSNLDSNFKLRLAVEAARVINMPKENIERAIARGSGPKEAAALESVTYEGFGPAGVAVIVEAVTDNRQRTAQEVRSVFERGGGRLAGPSSVDHLFKPMGEITIKNLGNNEEKVLSAAAEAGAEDVESDDQVAIVYCDPTSLEQVKNSLLASGLEITQAILSRKPTSIVSIKDEKNAQLVLSLVNKLDVLDDVQRVYANFDIPQEILLRNSEITK